MMTLRIVLCLSPLLMAGSAWADVFVTAVINNASFGAGQIQSWQLDLTMFCSYRLVPPHRRTPQ
jgi:hypothetical protein